MQDETSSVARRDLEIVRYFVVPVERLWAAWTDPARVRAWWGPAGYTSLKCQMDPREGGRYLFGMRSPAGKELWNTGTYMEIVPMERMVLTHSFADANGEIVSAAQYGLSSDFPLEMRVTVLFAPQPDGNTKLTIRQTGIPGGLTGNQAQSGWNESLDKLAAIF